MHLVCLEGFLKIWLRFSLYILILISIPLYVTNFVFEIEKNIQPHHRRRKLFNIGGGGGGGANPARPTSIFGGGLYR